MQIALAHEDWLKRSNPAIIQLNRYLVGVFRRGEDRRFCEFGSGILVQYQGEHYLATAGHNLAEEPMGITLWWFVAGSVGQSLEGASLEAACGASPLIRSVVEGDDLDLGLIKFRHPQALLDAGRKFYPLDGACSAPLEPDWYKGRLLFLLGYPGRYVEDVEVQRTPGGVYLPEPVLQQQMTSLPIPCFDDVKEVTDAWFRMEVECKDPDPDTEESLSYGGFSGGPVFRLIHPSGLEGNPDGFQLVGLEYSQQRSRHSALLRAHPIHRWCRFADEANS